MKRKQLHRYIRIAALPSLCLIVFFQIIPLLILLWDSLLNNNFEKSFAGFSNYIRFFQNESARLAIKNTILFLVIATILLLTVSYSLALLMQKASQTARKIFFFATTLPLFIPASAAAPLFIQTTEIAQSNTETPAIIMVYFYFLWKFESFRKLFV